MSREAPVLRILCLILLGLTLPARGEERFALLIGANAGWANDRLLHYAEADAERLRDVLVELGGFSSERVTLLKDPDSARLREHLARIAQEVNALGDKESLIVFYYSGHADGQHLHLRGQPFSHAELYETLRDFPATVRIGMLDACRSGSILDAKGGRRTSTFEVKVVNELRVRGLALLTSSGADELSQEAKAIAGSVFTHHLVSGLRGAGDFDGDGAVTLSETYRYARQRTEVDTSATTSPHRPAFLYELSGPGEPILTRPAQGGARLLLPRGEGERYVVVNAHGTRLVAEGRTRQGEQVALVLAPGTYQVTHVRADMLAVAPLTLAVDARVDAETLAYKRRPLSTGLLKGDPKDMDEEELHEWHRGEALRLLDDGEPEVALERFGKLLVRRPEDRSARRGQVRALVRLAELQSRRGAVEKTQELLSQALQEEPSLAEDPDFARHYRTLRERVSSKTQEQLIQKEVEEKVHYSPYILRRWAVALNVWGARAKFAPTGMLVIDEALVMEATLDWQGRALGLVARHIGGCGSIVQGKDHEETEFRVCNSLGVGLHLVGSELLGTPPAPVPETTSERFQDTLAASTSHLHVDAGLMAMISWGTFVSLDLGLALHRHAPSGLPRIVPLGSIRVGWFFH